MTLLACVVCFTVIRRIYRHICPFVVLRINIALVACFGWILVIVFFFGIGSDLGVIALVLLALLNLFLDGRLWGIFLANEHKVN